MSSNGFVLTSVIDFVAYRQTTMKIETPSTIDIQIKSPSTDFRRNHEEYRNIKVISTSQSLDDTDLINSMLSIKNL